MSRSLRVLYQYPGVGRPGEIVDESEVQHNPQALVDAGICEWVGQPDVSRSAVIETTDSAPARETTAVTPVKRGPGRPRKVVGGESAV